MGSGSAALPLDEAFQKQQSVLQTLWTQFAGLELPDGREELRILFVSPHHGAGTTTMASCTGLGLARHLGEDVALVELNLFTPAMAPYMGLAQAPGITDVLDGRVPAEAAIRNAKVDHVHVLSAGTRRAPRPGELAGSAARELLQAAFRGRRYAILDGPPVLEHPEMRPLVETADAAVLVLQARTTKTRDARKTVQALEEFGVPLFGSILNRFRSDMPFGIGGGDFP